MPGDLQLTIDSDDDGPIYDDAPVPSRGAATSTASKAKGKKRKRSVMDQEVAEERGGDSFNASFAFDGLGGATSARGHDAWSADLFKRKNAIPRVSVDDIIARRRAVGEGTVTRIADDESTATLKDDDDSEDDEGDSDLEAELDEEAGLDGSVGDSAESEGDEDDEHEPDQVKEASQGSDEEGEGIGFEALRELDDSDGDVLESADDADSDDGEEIVDKKSKAYFASPPPEIAPAEKQAPFSSLPNARLSRPVLLGLGSLGLTTPTPIQAATIPVVLMGKDVVGSSVTGSGKTVAFWVGVIERLLHRDKRTAKTRVVTICPTRELAVQVFNVGKALARYTDISFCLCVGGLSLKAQEGELKRYPDVVVSTPGRLIDHVRNTQCFTLDSLEILIIDEADRILEEGFRDELTEIISACPHSRSTLLFSATITEDVKELARLSLDKPVRIKIDTLGASSRTLTQEFLRVRDDRPRAKEAVLVAVCRKTFRGKTIVFFRSKAAAHRVQILFGLAGLRAAELHGDLSQEQRLQALERFRNGDVDYLLATDLASRGLDIKGVENVVNFEMPVSVDVYLHRVGRTARAGSTGRALTLVGEGDRKMVKVAVKHANPDSVKQRSIPADLVKKVAKELAGLEEEIEAVMAEEQEEKALRRTEMDLQKGENLLQHADEIAARPARTWFQTANEKKEAKSTGTRAHNAQFDGETKRPRKEKLNHKQRRRQEALQEGNTSRGAIGAAIRSVKKASRPTKLTAAPSAAPKSAAPTKKKKRKGGTSGFGVDLGDKRASVTGAPTKPKSKVKSSLSKKASGSKSANKGAKGGKVKGAKSKSGKPKGKGRR